MGRELVSFDGDFDAKMAFLANSRHWPGAPPSVQIINTHMSVVYLFAEHVYKLKKPISYGPLNYLSLEARQHACFEEYRLNQELAPGVYLKPMVLYQNEKKRFSFRSGCIVDWLVKMKRLDEQLMLKSMILRQDVDHPRLKACAARLAVFYRNQSAAPISHSLHLKRLRTTNVLNYEILNLVAGLDPIAIETVYSTLASVLKSESRLFGGRVIIEGHGDLRAEHICLQRPPVIIDRLEFDANYRYVDPLEDLALLAVDCAFLGDEKPAELVMQIFVDRCQQSLPMRLWHFYKSMHAFTRSRLVAWHIANVEDEMREYWLVRTQRLLEIAISESVKI